MAFEISNTPSASAPDIEGGLVPARFDGLAMVEHPDWAGDGKFGYDDGKRLHWTFTLLDEDGAVLYDDDADPIIVEAVNSANINTKSDKSKNAAWLKSVSPAAFAAVNAGQRFSADEMVGANCTLLIEIKDNGWPKVVNVLPAAKKSSRRTTSADEG